MGNLIGARKIFFIFAARIFRKFPVGRNTAFKNARTMLYYEEKSFALGALEKDPPPVYLTVQEHTERGADGMPQQRTVLCIQDLSCVGRSSLAAVLPTLAAAGKNLIAPRLTNNSERFF